MTVAIARENNPAAVNFLLRGTGGQVYTAQTKTAAPFGTAVPD
jgi:hypothetical protein